MASTKRDYYEILGVERGATADTIKGAYRKIAMQNHPDRNPGDAAAEQRFKDAAEAYAVLSDGDKRARYDQFGHAGVDGANSGGFTNFDDIAAQFGDLFGGGGGAGFFEQFFGGAGRRDGRRRGASLRVDLELTLEEVATGVRRSIEIARHVPCETCDATGARPGTKPQTCKTCAGHGQVTASQGFFQIRQACPTCRGQGTVITDPCEKCHGAGHVRRKSPIDLSIPAGIEQDHVERVAGQGEPGDRGGPPGDLIVVIHIQPHEFFARSGDDLLAQTRIGFRQAVLGDSIDVPTITGESVSLKIPPGTQPGERLRVRGHGLPRMDGYGRGHLIVQVQIDVPKKVDAEQRGLLERFDEIERKRNKSGRKKKGIFDAVRDIFQ